MVAAAYRGHFSNGCLGSDDTLVLTNLARARSTNSWSIRAGNCSDAGVMAFVRDLGSVLASEKANIATPAICLFGVGDLKILHYDRLILEIFRPTFFMALIKTQGQKQPNCGCVATIGMSDEKTGSDPSEKMLH